VCCCALGFSAGHSGVWRAGVQRVTDMEITQASAIGFIGLGVMGEPMCRNLAVKSGRPLVAFDRAAPALARLAAQGVTAALSVADLARQCDVIFLVQAAVPVTPTPRLRAPGRRPRPARSASWSVPRLQCLLSLHLCWR
jgi:phosphoglycerate dehydrogenase-like enzyme